MVASFRWRLPPAWKEIEGGKTMKLCKCTKSLLAVALALILLGSCLASLFNTGFGSVKVERISFDGGNGTLSGILYMPKDASAENPKPTIIVTHGYLNSAEMQDLNAIELSRRGFVVLALDQYDHGHSALRRDVYSDSSFFGVWLPFWLHSMNDAVNYMYDQPYVLKDAAGNGMIGVTGHSMGGFSTTLALAFDTLAYAENGHLKIRAGMPEGADFSYSAFVGIDAATSAATAAGRYMGRIAGQFDEFFFNDPTVEGGTVRKKDFVSTPDGKLWLEQENPQANTWYATSDGGQRIVYQPYETHPWNHFSTTSAGYVVDFYTTAFADCAHLLKDIPAGNQIWMWKEAFECVALVGFVMLILAVADLLLKLPFFKNAKVELPVLADAKGAKGIIGIVILAIAVLLPAIFFEPLMDQGAGSPAVMILAYAGIAAGAFGLLALVFGIIRKCRKCIVGGAILAVAGAALALVAKTPMYASNEIWTAIGINSIAYWTIASALISLVIMGIVFLALKAKDGVSLASYGITLKPMAIIAGICTGLATVVIAYAVLFLVDALLLVDFRVWTFAFKTFDADLLPAIIRYLPTFLLFYIASTASITINTNTEKLQGWKGYALAIVLNAAGPILWLAVQYITLFATGVAFWDGSALSGIMMVAMVPTLSIAAIISRNLYKKTGNIWAPAVLNAVLMTTMTIANTMVCYR